MVGRHNICGRMWRRGALVAVMVWLCAGTGEAAMSGTSGDVSSTDVRSTLTAQAREMKTVRVIVTLNVPFVPEGELKSTWQVFQQRNRIAQAQDRVLERLKTLGCHSFGTAKRFETVPQMALKADEICLEALWGDPDVKDVQGDSLSAPH